MSRFKSHRLIAKLERLMDARGVSQRELATAIGKFSTRVHLWLRGTGEPSAWEALQMARVFDVDPVWLTDEDDPRLDPPEAAPAPLSADETEVLDAWHATGIGRLEAVLRLATPRLVGANGRVLSAAELDAVKQALDRAREQPDGPGREKQAG